MLSDLCSLLSPLKYQQSWVGENAPKQTGLEHKHPEKKQNFLQKHFFFFLAWGIRVQLQTGILWTPVSINSSWKLPHGQLPEPLKNWFDNYSISLKFRVSNVKNVSNLESHLLLIEKSMSDSPLAPPTTADYAEWSLKEQLKWLLFEKKKKMEKRSQNMFSLRILNTISIFCHFCLCSHSYIVSGGG